MNIFSVGSMIRLSVGLQDIDGAAADPTAMTFRIRNPAGTVTTYEWQSDAELVRGAEGEFWVDWPVEMPGTHVYRWESTGAAQTAAEQAFTARASSFG